MRCARDREATGGELSSTQRGCAVRAAAHARAQEPGATPMQAGHVPMCLLCIVARSCEKMKNEDYGDPTGAHNTPTHCRDQRWQVPACEWSVEQIERASSIIKKKWVCRSWLPHTLPHSVRALGSHTHQSHAGNKLPTFHRVLSPVSRTQDSGKRSQNTV